MTRLSNASRLEFEEDITLNEIRLRKEKKKLVSSSLEPHIFTFEPSLEEPLEPSFENNLNNLMGEEAPEKTLRELYEPDVHQRPIGKVIPPTTTNFHLRSNLILNLPIIRGSNGEDPHKHLRDFSWACDLLRPHGVTEEQLNLRAFPFSLVDSAKRWLINLEPQTFTTWEQLKKRFLEKFFPITRAQTVLKEIYGARQSNNETLFEYWERYNELCARFPYNQLSERDIVQYFYTGLLPSVRDSIDAASGGALIDKTPFKGKRF